RPALEGLGVLSPQHGLDPGHQPWPTRWQVGEQADQLAAAPRVQGALHAVHEGLVGQPALGELVPELADRMISLRVGSTERFGRKGRVRRRPSHEWSIAPSGLRARGLHGPELPGRLPGAGHDLRVYLGAVRGLEREMAGRNVSRAERAELGLLGGAPFLGELAPGPEPAAG